MNSIIWQTNNSKDDSTNLKAAMVLHDIKRPLQILEENLLNLFSKVQDVGCQGHEIEDLSFASEQALKTILEIFKCHPPYLSEPYVAFCSVEKILDRCIYLLDRHKKTTNTEIDLDLRHTEQVHAHPIDFYRCVMNLLQNAFEARLGSKDHHRVWIHSRDVTWPNKDGGKGIEMWIGNTGKVIAEHHLTEVFKPYFTIGKAYGTGLGLSICQKIVHSYGGQIEIKSNRDVGTSVRFTLPSFHFDSKLTPRVAVIDDNPFILGEWKNHYPESHVYLFSSPDAFVSAASHLLNIDCIISDLRFEQRLLKPADLMRQLPAKYFHIPLFIASDWPEEISEVFARVEKGPMPPAIIECLIKSVDLKKRNRRPVIHSEEAKV